MPPAIDRRAITDTREPSLIAHADLADHVTSRARRLARGRAVYAASSGGGTGASEDEERPSRQIHASLPSSWPRPAAVGSAGSVVDKVELFPGPDRRSISDQRRATG